MAKGCTYDSLHRNIAIFICLFDIFGFGRHKYSFEYLCLEDSNIKLYDETSTIILNTEGTLNDVDEDMKAFLAYVKSSTGDVVEASGNPVLQTIHKQVETVKADKLMEVMYMKYEEKMKRERDEGYAEGASKGKNEVAINMLKESLPIDLVSRITGLSEEELAGLRDEISG